MIEVFNRSYYEDILVPSIAKTLPKKHIDHRCGLINLLEQHLEMSNVHILKLSQVSAQHITGRCAAMTSSGFAACYES
jgi:polyphosphate kinase 2 (PPK2 family)